MNVVNENYNRRDNVKWIDDGENKPSVIRGVFPGFIFVKLPHQVSCQGPVELLRIEKLRRAPIG